MAKIMAYGSCFQKIHIFRDQPLGTGSYGMVCKAQCDELLCAAKLLHPTIMSDWTIQKFHEECQLLRSVKHPNIIQYLGTYDEGPQNPVLIIELMEQSLTSYLEESPCPLQFHYQVDIFHDVSLALAYLHSNNIIHRDLSSNNVLLTKDKRAKVTDFGMSKLIGSNQNMLRLTQAPGCIVYMPPEALRDHPVYSNKLDCFSLGVVTIQTLTRKFPDPGSACKRVNDPNYPHPVEVPIPEIERRKSHIDLIEPGHPLLKLALKCLCYDENSRPTSKDLCSHVLEIKRSRQYFEAVDEDRKQTKELKSIRQELTQLRERLQASEKDKKLLEVSSKRLTSLLLRYESFCREVIAGSDIYNIVCSKFQKKWALEEGLCPKVEYIFEVVVSNELQSRWDAYKATLTNKGSPVGVEEYYHGTRMECYLDKTKTLCENSHCSVCGISRHGMKLDCDVKKSLSQPNLGPGLYLAPNSSTSHLYTTENTKYRSMLLCDVLPGKKHVVMRYCVNLTAPSDCDSVYGLPTGGLEYAELLLYKEAAILPRYIIMYLHELKYW